jgi:hypothetical protein
MPIAIPLATPLLPNTREAKLGATQTHSGGINATTAMPTIAAKS